MTDPVTGHERWADDAATYVLHALDGDELPAFERHLAECAVCRDEVATLQLAADALPGAAPPLAAPPELKARIMATVRSEADLLRAAGAGADRPPVRRRPAARIRLGGLDPARAVAAAVMLGAGVVLGALVIGGGPGQGPVRLASVDTQALPGATAALRRSGQTVALEVDHLRPPGAGHVYEVWLKRPGQAPRPSSLFSVTSGSVRLTGDLRGVSTVMVTDEPEGGSRVPTRQPLIVAASV